MSLNHGSVMHGVSWGLLVVAAGVALPFAVSPAAATDALPETLIIQVEEVLIEDFAIDATLVVVALPEDPDALSLAADLPALFKPDDVPTDVDVDTIGPASDVPSLEGEHIRDRVRLARVRALGADNGNAGAPPADIIPATWGIIKELYSDIP